MEDRVFIPSRKGNAYPIPLCPLMQCKLPGCPKPHGLAHATADGKKIRFWMHTWVGDSIAARPMPLHEQKLLVVDYRDYDRGWRWEFFSDFLPTATLQQIASYDLVREDQALTYFTWKARNNSETGNQTSNWDGKQAQPEGQLAHHIEDSPVEKESEFRHLTMRKNEYDGIVVGATEHPIMN
ncbi:hypothetical protein Cgig2_030447 [Carnegiea gigantea]|uniref:Uncharacterized protein n=1 Tax=Carnegiea gigantea TaxID=171969 RepID=A0A9Q1KQX5_9CARY|nr:hypothetical protein Cgig2_030447 [Carnegiea gigantea]